MPIYEDSKTVVYKIPKPASSEPFLLLGSGWHQYNKCEGEIENVHHCNARSTMKNSEILIVNPTNSGIDITLNLVLSSANNEFGVQNKKTVVVSLNNEKMETLNILPTPMNIQIENLILKPGINVDTLDTNQISPVYFGIIGTEIEDMKELTLSFHVKSISIMN